MKIIHICQFLGVGGLEKVLFSLIQEQVSSGHQVEVIVYDHDKRWVPKYQELGITVHTDYQKDAGYDFKLLIYLSKKIKDFSPQIVHTHDLNPVLYVGILRLFMPRKINLIHTTHGMEHIQTHPKTKFYEIFLGFICKHIICVSPSFKSYYQKQFFTKKKKVHLINNGTQINEAERDQVKDKSFKDSLFNSLSFSTKMPTAIYIARIVPLKGQDLIMKAFKTIEHQLLIVGPSGNDAYYKECENLCSSRVKMLGSRDDIKDLLNCADYFISPSLHEGLPIAVLEAGVQKRVCLLSNIPGHTTFNKDNECVLIFNDINDLKYKTSEALQRDELAQRFYKHIEQNYSAQTMAKDYDKIYRKSL